MESLPQKWKRNKDTVTAELRTQAQKHANRPNSRLGMLPNNHKRHSGRGIERRVKALSEVTPAEVRRLAGMAEPNFEKMLGMILDDPRRREQFRLLGAVAKSGTKTTIITLHDENPVDIAIAQALTVCVEDELGYQPKTGLVLSKIMAHLGFELTPGAKPIPAVDLLRIMGNVYFSFPRTDSIKESDIADDVIGMYNASLRHLVAKDRRRGDFVLAAAPTGTMGRPNELDNSVLDIAPVKEATVGMISGLVLPMVLRVFKNEPFLEVLPITLVNSVPEIDAVMLDMCRTTEELTNNTERLQYLGLSLS